METKLEYNVTMIPPALHEIIQQDCEINPGIIDTIRIVPTTKLVAYPRVAIFEPESKTVEISLDNVLKASLQSPLLIIPSVWFTLLTTWWHELTHAFQLEDLPDLLFEDPLQDKYEAEARDAATVYLSEWLEENKIPPLAEWGYLGEKIEYIINTNYAVHPQIIDEYNISKAGGVIDVAKLNQWVSTVSMEDMRGFMKEIEKPNNPIGIKFDDKYFLNASSAIALCV